MGIISFFGWFRQNPSARMVIFLSCVVGTGYGFYYYLGQFALTPSYLWVFVPDSPFFTMMYTISLGLYITGRRYNAFDVFTFIGLNKVGIWTLIVFLVEFDYYFSSQRWSFTLVLAALHVGMILVSLTLLEKLELPSMRVGLLIIGYFFLGDVMDYVVGLHPIVPYDNIGIIGASAFVLTLIVSLLTYYCLKNV